MNKFLPIIFFIIFTGCGSVPTDSNSVSKDITIEHDKFKDQTWIETKKYLSSKGVTDTFPVKIKYRAMYDKGNLAFIQIYVSKMDTDWGFYYQAVGEDGVELGFSNIDSYSDADAGMVTTTEIFGLELNKEYLKKMTGKDWEIKAYGKNNRGEFTVQKSLSLAFYNKLICFENKTCS